MLEMFVGSCYFSVQCFRYEHDILVIIVCGLMQCTVTSKIQYIVISVQLLVLTESQLIHQFIYSNYRYLKTYLFESVSGLW